MKNKNISYGLVLFIVIIFNTFHLSFSQPEDDNSWYDLKEIKIEKQETDLINIRFILTGKCKFSAFRVENPARLILEIQNSIMKLPQKDIMLKHNLVEKIFAAQYKDKPIKIVRVVLELNKDISYKISPVENDILLELFPITAADKIQENAATKLETKEKKDIKIEVKNQINEMKIQEKKVQENKTEGKKVKKAISLPVEYIIQKGDNLYKISKKFYYKTDYWEKIYIVNSNIIKDKSNLFEGTKIKIPTEAEIKKVKLQQSTDALTSKKVNKENIKKQEEKKTDKKEVTKIESKDTTSLETKKITPKIIRKKTEQTKEKLVKAGLLKDTDVKAGKYIVPEKQKEQIKKIKEKIKEKPVNISFDFTEADIRDVLNVLAEEMNINIIWEEGVSGNISIHLKDVTFEDALDTILSQKGYSYEVLNPSTIKILSKAINITQIIPLNYALASEVSGMLTGILSVTAKVMVDSRQNSLIINDSSEYINKAKKMISILDQKPKQVMIEAKIMEITIDKNTDLGIEWEVSQGNQGTNDFVIGQTDPGLVYGRNFPTATNNVKAAAGGTGVSALPTSSIGSFTFGYITSNMALTSRIAAAQKKGNAKILSQPRIATLNNKPASIMIGDKLAYPAGSTTGAGGTTSNTAFLDVGILLNVTPIINQDDRITLQIIATVSSARGAGSPPPIQTRTANTNLLVKDGETIVIGGLISENDLSSVDQLPLLGDLPILGYLFKHRADIYSRNELLIFLSPTIMKE